MTAEQERLVADNLPLVKHVIHKYCWKYLELQEYDDLFQIGCLGLVKATLAYDPARGTAFSTLASAAIKHEIMKTMQSRRKREELYHRADDLSVYEQLAGNKGETGLFRYETLPDPYDSIRAVELHMDIERALSHCTKPQREAFLVRVVDGRTLDEAGLLLGISRMAVDYRLRVLGNRFRKEGVLP